MAVAGKLLVSTSDGLFADAVSMRATFAALVVDEEFAWVVLGGTEAWNEASISAAVPRTDAGTCNAFATCPSSTLLP